VTAGIDSEHPARRDASLPMVPLATLRYALAVLAVVALCAGCGSGGSSKTSAAKTSAADYVKAVCSAISPLERDVVTRSSALNIPATDATHAKKTLQGFLGAVEQDSEHALTRIQAAGTPDIAHGTAVAGTIVKVFTQLRDTMRIAVTTAQSLPTDSAASFKAGAQQLGSSVRGSLKNLDSSGLSNPDIEKAAASQPACKSLNS